MDYHLLFFTPSPTPSPSPSASIATAGFAKYVNDTEVKLFWWGFRASFYYILAREVAPRIARLWAVFKAYVEARFPTPLQGLVRELAKDAEEAAGEVLDDVDQELGESTDELAKGMAADPAFTDPGPSSTKRD
jgi:hypothetical protein